MGYQHFMTSKGKEPLHYVLLDIQERTTLSPLSNRDACKQQLPWFIDLNKVNPTTSCFFFLNVFSFSRENLIRPLESNLTLTFQHAVFLSGKLDKKYKQNEG